MACVSLLLIYMIYIEVSPPQVIVPLTYFTALLLLSCLAPPQTLFFIVFQASVA